MPPRVATLSKTGTGAHPSRADGCSVRWKPSVSRRTPQQKVASHAATHSGGTWTACRLVSHHRHAWWCRGLHLQAQECRPPECHRTAPTVPYCWRPSTESEGHKAAPPVSLATTAVIATSKSRTAWKAAKSGTAAAFPGANAPPAAAVCGFHPPPPNRGG